MDQCFLLILEKPPSVFGQMLYYAFCDPKFTTVTVVVLLGSLLFLKIRAEVFIASSESYYQT